MSNSSLSDLADDDLVDEKTACRILGGSNSPIARATIWRGIKAGRSPEPIKVGPATNRWRVGELRSRIAEFVAERAA